MSIMSWRKGTFLLLFGVFFFKTAFRLDQTRFHFGPCQDPERPAVAECIDKTNKNNKKVNK